MATDNISTQPIDREYFEFNRNVDVSNHSNGIVVRVTSIQEGNAISARPRPDAIVGIRICRKRNHRVLRIEDTVWIIWFS